MPASYSVTASTTLLPFLFDSLPEVKKTKIRQWLKFGAVLVNGVATTQFNTPLKPGDVISLRTEKAQREQSLLPAGMKVYHEDEHLIVVQKPENLLSIASEAEQEDTAYAHLTNYVRRGRERARDRIWIVHRLDRETSGLMIFARTMEMKEALQSNWNQAEKRYLAVVEGVLKKDSGTMHSHLNETNPYRVRSAPPSEVTREAITHYQVLKRNQGRTLVELTLETGRRHQIRVQLADLGHPIIGDEKYAAQTDPAKRLGLHSHRLRFVHPATGEELDLTSPLPLELVRLV